MARHRQSIVLNGPHANLEYGFCPLRPGETANMKIIRTTISSMIFASKKKQNIANNKGFWLNTKTKQEE